MAISPTGRNPSALPATGDPGPPSTAGRPGGDAESSSGSGIFGRLGRFTVRRRWAIVLIWAAILLVAAPIAPGVVGALRAGGFILDDLESARAKTLLQTEL